jgi:hypothetical protein
VIVPLAFHASQGGAPRPTGLTVGPHGQADSRWQPVRRIRRLFSCDEAGLCGRLPLAIGMLAGQLRRHPARTGAGLAAGLAKARDRPAVKRAENGLLSVSASPIRKPAGRFAAAST